MPTDKRTKALKVRFTPDEYRRIVALARGSGSLARFLRSQAFGRETVLRLGSLHSAVLEVARLLGDRPETVEVAQVLAQMVVIERHLNHLLAEVHR